MRLCAVSLAIEKHPEAFREGFAATTRCGCRRSGCKKKYCDCFAAGVRCGPECGCEGCENNGAAEDDEDDRDHAAAAAAASVAAAAGGAAAVGGVSSSISQPASAAGHGMLISSSLLSSSSSSSSSSGLHQLESRVHAGLDAALCGIVDILAGFKATGAIASVRAALHPPSDQGMVPVQGALTTSGTETPLPAPVAPLARKPKAPQQQELQTERQRKRIADAPGNLGKKRVFAGSGEDGSFKVILH